MSTNNQDLQDHDNNYHFPSGADDFELLIGSLNQVLEKMYGCQICYDKAEEPSDHISNLAIPKGKTLFDGFAIFVHEEEINDYETFHSIRDESVLKSIDIIRRYLDDVEVDGYQNLRSDLSDIQEKFRMTFK